LARLHELVDSVASAPKKRIATRPTLAAKRRRLDEKTKRGALKAERRSVQ
jgi:ribosome-associated protein